MTNDVYVIDARRTAIGNFCGSFSNVPAHELSAAVIKEIITNQPIEAENISEVIIGQVLMTGMGQNPARQASFSAGIPKEVPSFNISQVCGSGLKSISLAFNAIKSGESEIVIAGGQENMSMSPHSMTLRQGVKMGAAQMQDSMIVDGLTDAYGKYHMGLTAENIAEKFNITKEEQDQFACESQNKAEKACNEGKFKDEICPITVKIKRQDHIVEKDEFIKKGTSLASIAKLKPAFKKDGTVTAGNASGLNDGAAILMLASESAVKKFGLKPIARVASSSVAGVSPEIMGTGPIPAVKMALQKAGISINDLDLIEANEAFAAQAISVNRQLEWDLEKVNVNGGAIALGHPIGASGARVLVTLLHEMKRRKDKWGIATLCIGGGMGIALTVEMV